MLREITLEEKLSQRLLIGEMLARQARKHPDKQCIVFEEKRQTYLETNKRVNRLAHALLNRGVGRSDRVALLMQNCSEYLECYFALCKIGAVAVPINFRYVENEIAFQVNNSGSKAMIMGQEYIDTIMNAQQEMPGLKILIGIGEKKAKVEAYEKILDESREDEPLIDVEEGDAAFIMYTAGTTGRSKGAVLTQRGQMLNASVYAMESGLRKDEIYLCIPPLFHEAALCLSLAVIYPGGSVVIMKQFDPEEVLRLITKEKATFVYMVPAMAIRFLQVPGLAESDTSSLRRWGTGAAIMPLELKENVRRFFPGVGFVEYFGQTEMSPGVTILQPEDAYTHLGSVGQVQTNVEVRIVDDNDNDVPPGEVGEGIYRGPTVLKEYWDNPEATAEAMRNGWFHSGDLIRMDEEGFVYVVGRKKDMIISGGENIYPAEIEEVLYASPKILEAAVIGVPDPKWGESVKTFIVLKPGEEMSHQEVIELCKANLASYKKPKFVEFVDRLPRNAAGKVLKTVLRERKH
jgi:acyl-CoA synthetase (AMP-forming)/AMP-acid ligase II